MTGDRIVTLGTDPETGEADEPGGRGQVPVDASNATSPRQVDAIIHRLVRLKGAAGGRHRSAIKHLTRMLLDVLGRRARRPTSVEELVP